MTRQIPPGGKRRLTSAPQLWIGLLGLVLIQILLAAGVRFVAVWLTPLMWTAYIAFIDGLVRRLNGASWLTDRRREFPLLILASIGVWLLFEAYNLHLKNWIYVNVPPDPFVRDIAYFWSFATIMPGVFETSELVLTLLERAHREASPTPGYSRPPSSISPLWFVLGLGMITLPAAAPTTIAPYLFALVWVGFFLMFDPLNRLVGSVSLTGLFRNGRRLPTYALLIGGGLCGLLWEAWNLQASLAGGGHWVYTIPQALRIFNLHYGKMPVLGLLGFPPFALELFAVYIFLRQALGGDRIWHPSDPASAFPLFAERPAR
jgi:hypothetical protein